jgi:hypothetical protein
MGLTRWDQGRWLGCFALAVFALMALTAGPAGAALKTTTNTIDVNPGSAAGAGVSCGRAGEVSAGFSMPVVPGTSGPKLFPYFAPGLTAAANFGDEVGTLTSIGYCSKNAPNLTPKEKTTNVPPGDTGSVTAKCPKGKRVMFGGFESPEPLPGAAPPEFGIYPFTSKRVGNRRWKVSGFADIHGAEPEPQFLRSRAFCYGNGPSLTVRSKKTTIADGDTGVVKAKCKADEIAVSGGFKSSAEGSGAATAYARSFVSKRAGKRRWKVAAFGEGRGDSPLRAFAYCAPTGAL